MKRKYVLVGFPEIQDFMDHSRWGECILCQYIEGHPVEDSTYAIPEDLYLEVVRDCPEVIKRLLGKDFKTSEGWVKVIGFNGNMAICQVSEDKVGWESLTENDIILLPQERPNYRYVSMTEFI